MSTHNTRHYEINKLRNFLFLITYANHLYFVKLLTTILLFFQLVIGCAPIQTIEREISILSLKYGYLNGDKYINDFYNCSVEGPGQWTSSRGWPLYLVQYNAPDHVTKTWLKVVEPVAGQKLTCHTLLEAFISKKKTYKKVSSSNLSIEQLSCLLTVFENHWNDDPSRELMKSMVSFCSSDVYGYILEATTPIIFFDNYQSRFVAFFKSLATLDAKGKSPVSDEPDRVAIQQPVVKKTEDEDTYPGFQQSRKEIIHIVKEGETLGSISEKYFGTATKWQQIAQHNGIHDPRNINIGDRLKIVDAMSSRSSNDGGLKEKRIPENTQKKSQKKDPTPASITRQEAKIEQLQTPKEISHDVGNSKKKIPAEPDLKLEVSQQKAMVDEADNKPSKTVQIVRSPLDPINKKYVQLMSGPGPYPVYKILAEIKFGQILECVATSGHYIKVLYQNDQGYIFYKNIKEIEKK